MLAEAVEIEYRRAVSTRIDNIPTALMRAGGAAVDNDAARWDGPTLARSGTVGDSLCWGGSLHTFRPLSGGETKALIYLRYD
jgi:hypothetical protein